MGLRDSWVRQEHPLKDGGADLLERNAGHMYRRIAGSNQPPEFPGVSGIVKYVESFDSGFGAGQGWATKLIRESRGDYGLPRRAGDEGRDMGVQLHGEVDAFIKSEGKTAATSPMFASWRDVVDPLFKWLASELFLVDEELGFGGTCDSIGRNQDTGELTIIDLKTVDPVSWQRYGSKHKRETNSAQLAAYASGLHRLNSTFAPERGFIVYVLRDGSGTFLEEVDFDRGYKFFMAAKQMHDLHQHYDGRK